MGKQSTILLFLLICGAIFVFFLFQTSCTQQYSSTSPLESHIIRGSASDRPMSPLRKALTRYSREKPLIVAEGNYGAREMFQNFACWAERSGVLDQTLMIPLDSGMAKLLEERSLPHFFDPSLKVFGNGTYDFNTPGFRNISIARLSIFLKILSEGFSVFHADSDVIIMKNMFEHLPYLDVCDMEIQSDLEFNVDVASLKDPSKIPIRALCAGAFLIKSTLRGISFFNMWTRRAIKDATDDNLAMTNMLTELKNSKQAYVYTDLNDPNLLNADPNDLSAPYRICVLSPWKFPSGAIYSFEGQVKELEKVDPDGPVLAHVNWIPNLADKKALLKRRGKWLVTDDLQCINHQQYLLSGELAE